MFVPLLQKMFGSTNERYIKKLSSLIDAIRQQESTLERLTDEELKGQTLMFRQRISQGETLDDLLIEAFATVREASKRILGMRHFDVQMMGGIILHRGKVIEMATGEGKTLMSTLPAYLNALSGKGVHIVTVNDYLAHRDSEDMGQIFRFLGLEVGCILHDLDDEDRQKAYKADITYATNNELGFDYLRDNMKFRLEHMTQRPFNYAIIDEVDSILIDEARTPLIISGPTEDSSELYARIDGLIPQLVEADYEKDEKGRSITLTDQGSQKIEDLLAQEGLLQGGSLYDIHNISLVHHVNQALKAHKLFAKDVDYMIQNDKVIIIDEFTGRMMEGRRYSDGLHQALEAKERVSIQMENQTLASITFQNLFRIYPKLSGMTGTAKTEAAELQDIYKFKEVIQIPTNLPMIRKDLDDEVYRTEGEKLKAILTLIKEAKDRQQPVLVGTVSIEKSEQLSALMKNAGISHQVLNARYHEQEAHIIAEAGQPGAVTIATNMAGRGTDIKLGGNLDMRLAAELARHPNESDMERAERETALRADIKTAEAQVKAAGGLLVIGTERHESRRIDNQLRGRSGRQGDPGMSKFFLALTDDLMRIFGSERLDSMLQKLGLQEGEAIVHPWINRALERAQQKVEARNYDTRKQLLKYDDVMNDQRKVIYEQRRDLIVRQDNHELIDDMIEEVLQTCLAQAIPENTYADQWDIRALHEEVLRIFGLTLSLEDWRQEEGIAGSEFYERIHKAIKDKLAEKEVKYEGSLMRMAEKTILLQVLDQAWKDHLHALDYVRQGINLRAYAQRDPLNEYKQEAFNLYEAMKAKIKEQVISALCHLELHQHSADEVFEAGLGDREEAQRHLLDAHRHRLDDLMASDPLSDNVQAPKTRNALCPCGSGKRYKHCHGQ